MEPMETATESEGGVVARVKFYNSVLADAIAKAGSGRALALYSGVHEQTIYGYHTFKLCPFDRLRGHEGQLTKKAVVLRDFIADYLGVSAESVFPPGLYAVKWPRLLERRYSAAEFISLGEAKYNALTDGGLGEIGDSLKDSLAEVYEK